jgi:hypothetical protein
VNGDTRYMNFQNPGSTLYGTKTPLKMSVSEKRS